MPACLRCTLDDYRTTPRPDGILHQPTTPEPDVELLEEWASEAVCEATDGCTGIELDGHCPHGHESWPLRLHFV
jgi:hypothetical protein